MTENVFQRKSLQQKTVQTITEPVGMINIITEIFWETST